MQATFRFTPCLCILMSTVWYSFLVVSGFGEGVEGEGGEGGRKERRLPDEVDIHWRKVFEVFAAEPLEVIGHTGCPSPLTGWAQEEFAGMARQL